MGASQLPLGLGPRLCQESDNLARALPDREKPDRSLTRAQSPRSPAHSRPAQLSRAPLRGSALGGLGARPGGCGGRGRAGPGRGLASALPPPDPPRTPEATVGLQLGFAFLWPLPGRMAPFMVYRKRFYAKRLKIEFLLTWL